MRRIVTVLCNHHMDAPCNVKFNGSDEKFVCNTIELGVLNFMMITRVRVQSFKIQLNHPQICLRFWKKPARFSNRKLYLETLSRVLVFLYFFHFSRTVRKSHKI
jgi:hypothetical protein